MIEFALYEHERIRQLVVPRVLAKTVELQRYVVELPEGVQLRIEDDNSQSETELSPKKLQEKQFYTDFWREFFLRTQMCTHIK